ANSDYLNADVNRAIDAVLYGLTGEITVNGVKYNSVMTAQTVTDREAANVLTYVYNNWGNNGTEVTDEMVNSRRKNGAKNKYLSIEFKIKAAMFYKLITSLTLCFASLMVLGQFENMAEIKGGSYIPLYGTDSSRVVINDFAIDVYPVSNAEFEVFLSKYPEWNKGRVIALYADGNYLTQF